MTKRPFDIREYKSALRKRYKAIREGMSPEERLAKDTRILHNITSTDLYRHCRTVLVYVSTPQEVDTHGLIRKALSDGKQVAVPYCIDGTRMMDFYLIRGLEELRRRTFGVLEPVPEQSRKLTSFEQSLCLLPGLSFDRYGYRLGYGGGYYDRFLSKKYTGPTLGICYQKCSRPRLVHGRFDVACQYIVTERGVFPAKKIEGPRKRALRL